MPAKKINPRLIKLHHTYTAGEVAERLGTHRNTVLQWRRQGLAAIDNQRPLLFQGATLRAYLERRRADGKRPCPVGTLYCLKCRAPRPPALDRLFLSSQHYKPPKSWNNLRLEKARHRQFCEKSDAGDSYLNRLYALQEIAAAGNIG